ncbi:hypothetical protein [Roseobacter sinensis]|uniref:DUF2975 domain-containing protein n=1 Tax=Roseobacter sinensis TaxID=2931391 RepID=A0ABT3BH20_9RHOB|nr:hypothetical protein [Roseobacter sp. WL0113]MCV3272880.1 hypothetical protein [Roseobacter sp. WL0113]
MIDPDRLTASARRLQIVMTSGLVLLCVLAVALAVWLFAATADLGEGLARMSGGSPGPLAAWQIAVLAGLLAVHLAVWCVLLGMARAMFGHLAAGDPEAAARSARRLAASLWVMLGWGLVSQLIASPVATWGLGDGARSLSLSLGPLQLSLLLSALFAGFMARAFALGAELWRDHRAVV